MSLLTFTAGLARWRTLVILLVPPALGPAGRNIWDSTVPFVLECCRPELKRPADQIHTRLLPRLPALPLHL